MFWACEGHPPTYQPQPQSIDMTRHITTLCDDNPEPHSERIDADLLIPGKGEPIKNGTVIFKDGKIEYAGPQKDVPIQYVSTQSKATRVNVLMPGLWDCHVILSSFHYYCLLPLLNGGPRNRYAKMDSGVLTSPHSVTSSASTAYISRI